MQKSRLIVGLGNPSREYEYTRHNLGFLVVRHWAEQHKLKFMKKSPVNGLVAEGKVDDKDLVLLLPLTYVNKSGVAVKQCLAQYGLTVDQILVVCDDFQIDFGRLRLRAKGSDGGHNGLSSVIQHLKTQDFARLRVGIGPPPSAKEETTDFVLGEFSKKEKGQLDDLLQEAAALCDRWIREGQ